MKLKSSLRLWLVSMGAIVGTLLCACSNTSTITDSSTLDQQQHDMSGTLDTSANEDVTVDGVQEDMLSDLLGDHEVDQHSVDSVVDTVIDSATLDQTVDSASSDSSPPPTNQICAQPETIAIGDQEQTITGTTQGAKDEFSGVNCGGFSSFSGPQVYYEVDLSPTSGIALTFTPNFVSQLYLFSSSGGCSDGAINLYCGSGGLTGAVLTAVQKDSTRTLTFVPSVAGKYKIAIDSTTTVHNGSFVLKVKRYAAPQNGSCTKAEAVTFTDGSATIQGNIAGAKDEFSGVTCGTSSAFKGPQLYYAIPLEQGKTYRVLFYAAYAGSVYLFRQSVGCTQAAIQSDCGGTQGAVLTSTTALKAKTVYFSPSSTGNYLFVVDSTSTPPSGEGSFFLDVAAIVTPGNATCATAQSLTFDNYVAYAEGDTVGLANEFGAAITCGASPSKKGPQTYYKVDLKANVTYRFGVFASFEPFVYAFRAQHGCNDSAIETACSDSNGVEGWAIKPYANGSTIFSYAPEQDGTYYIVIDSADITDAYYGYYQLEIFAFDPPKQTAPFSWDFENDCGPIAATEEWQCGEYSFSSGATCSPGATPPPSTKSGKQMWGTQLNDCHRNLANAGNVNCSDTSTIDDAILSFRVEFPSTWTKATLTYWSWEDFKQPEDWAELRVNGQSVSQQCSLVSLPSSGATWVERTIDLTPYLGTGALIGFHFKSSSSRNWSGWYLDDLSVSGQ